MSLTNENIDLLEHLARYSIRITFALFVALVCVLEMVGCNWDRGYLDKAIEVMNRACGVGKAKIMLEESRGDLEKNVAGEEVVVFARI